MTKPNKKTAECCAECTKKHGGHVDQNPTSYLKWLQPIIFAASLITAGSVGHYRLGLVELKADKLETDFSMRAIQSATTMQRFEQVERDSTATKLDIKEIRATLGILQLQTARICAKLKCD